VKTARAYPSGEPEEGSAQAGGLAMQAKNDMERISSGPELPSWSIHGGWKILVGASEQGNNIWPGADGGAGLEADTRVHGRSTHLPQS
jgi:hypothetical protein